MTYPPGGPGYSSAPQPQYTAPTQQFDRVQEPAAPAGPSQLPLYLGAAVAVLGFAIFLTGFAPVFGTVAGIGLSSGFLIIAPLFAGLLAGISLLPKQDDRTGIAAVLAVFGFLFLILTVIGDGPSIKWGFYLFIVFSVLQAIAAVGKLLLDAGIITAPAPRPRYEQPQGYGPSGPYSAPPQGYAPQQGYGGPPQQGYGSQYGGYPGGAPGGSGAPGTGGFPALGRPNGPQGGPPQGAPQSAPQGGHTGPPTPPTGFPAFGQPQQAAPTVATPLGGYGAQPTPGSHEPQAESQGSHSQPTTQHPIQQAPQQSTPPPS